jgi:hypothetical protein
MKTTTLLISIGLALGAVIADALTDGLILSSRTTAIAQPKTYPPLAIDVFIDTCAQKGTVSRSHCECIINELQQTLSFADLMTYSQRNKANSPPPAAFSNAASVCLSASNPAISESQTPSEKRFSLPTPYPPFIVQAYMQGCESEGKAPHQFCQCSIDELQKHLSLNEFMQLSWQLQQDPSTPTPFAFHEAVLFCSIEHDLSDSLQAPAGKGLSIYASRL